MNKLFLKIFCNAVIVEILIWVCKHNSVILYVCFVGNLNYFKTNVLC